jgi:hypothetical protein
MAQGDYSAAVYDVVMTQGDTFREDFIVRDTDGSLLGLGGYTFASQVRQTAAGTAVVTMDADGGHGHLYGDADVRYCRVRRPRARYLRP